MKKIISLVIVISIILCTSCFSASAALDYTEDYYMNGYKMHGSIVMNNIQTSASTYCENIGYGKAVNLTYCYLVDNNPKYVYRGNIVTFVTNGFDHFECHYTYTSKTDNYHGAIGQHSVKASEYMIWYSYESRDDTFVGHLTPIYPSE